MNALHQRSIVIDGLSIANWSRAVFEDMPKGGLTAAIDFDPYAADMDKLIDAWLPVEFATNNLNRSMGLTDLYPFLLSPRVIDKLSFVHVLMLVREAALRKTA